MTVSVIMPFYHKLHEFRHVLPFNSPYLRDPSVEVILCLDDDSETLGVLELAQQYRDLKWRIVACHEKHEWRAPAKPINVGIKHARGKYILIVSPESIFVN